MQDCYKNIDEIEAKLLSMNDGGTQSVSDKQKKPCQNYFEFLSRLEDPFTPLDQLLKDLSHKFEFETLLVKAAWCDPKNEKNEYRPPLDRLTLSVVQKKQGSLSLPAFSLRRN